MLTLYNSRTGTKERFLPLDPQKVTMYVCGPTVYDRIHLGNARSAVVFDALYRLLQGLFKEVLYVRNVTDVDDKINQAAWSRGIPIQKLTEETTRFFHEDLQGLSVLPPSIEPKATEHIPQMIALTEMLIQKNIAYVHEGHVLFHVEAFPSYGQLSHREWEQMKIGARVEVAPYKKNPVDFVLWKPSSEKEIGWESPWGRGRPGWHIECSAMSSCYLGEVFDIHGGGSDLLFPHHENERAQSCAISGQPDCARFWIHNGMLTVEGQKMAKSLGNFITLNAALEKTAGEVIRWALLSSHYRHSLDWNAKLLQQSQTCLDQLYRSLDADSAATTPHPEVLAALCDDLNTPLAFSVLQKLAHALNKTKDPLERKEVSGHLLASGQLMGLFQKSKESWFQKPLRISLETIEDTIKKRTAAKAARDYAEADQLRQFLLEKGIVLEDHSDGRTTWSSS